MITRTHLLARLLARLHTRLYAWLIASPPDPPTFVDVSATHRKQAIADWEYSAAADAECRVLRRSGQAVAYRRLPAVMERTKERV